MAYWNIEAGTFISCLPEDVFKAVTDFKNAPLVPGIKKAKHISGQEKQVGAIYRCQFGLKGIGLGELEIEVVEVEPPSSTTVRLTQVNLPLGGIIFEVGGKAKWTVTPDENGARATLETEGEIGGLAGRLPGIQERVDREMKEAVRDTLNNLKNQLQNST